MAWRQQLSRSVKELRFLFCQTSPASAETRYQFSLASHIQRGFVLDQIKKEFVHKNYKALKTLNPKLPILIRECRGVEPQLWARYDMGVERCVRLDGLTEDQINKKLEELAKAGKATIA